MNRQIPTISLTLLCLVIAAACGDDNGTGSKDEPVPAELVAEWTFMSGTVNGGPVALSTLLGWDSNTTHAILVIDANGSYVYYEKDDDSAVVREGAGEFKVEGDKFTLTGGSLPVGGGTWTVSGSQLSLSAEIQGYTWIIQAIKPDAAGDSLATKLARQANRQ
jgi:hypothetical protein